MEMPVKCNVLKIFKVADSSQEGMTKIQGYRVEGGFSGWQGRKGIACCWPQTFSRMAQNRFDPTGR